MMLPLPSVHLTCPYPLDSLKGNVVSARRIAGILSELGYPVSTSTVGDPQIYSADVHLAMHATRSHAEIADYRSQKPNGKTIILLTGTDLYLDLPRGDEHCLQSMRWADLLVVTQKSSLASVPDEHLAKTKVVSKSLQQLPPKVDRSVRSDDGLFAIETVFHGRWTKNPFLLLEAISILPELDNLRVRHIGSARGAGFADEANEWLRREPRYEWLGELPREEAMRRIQLADLTVNTSRVEGGANVIVEAVMCGVPLLATSIEATVGQLGSDFPGLYPSEDAKALANLIRRCHDDRDFLDTLRSATISRRGEFTREAEAKGWAAAISGVV